MARELVIQTIDGQLTPIPLDGSRLVVGRSSAVELSFPEDAGLSRQHFAFEAQGEDWTVQDLGSKNGTFVNNIPLKARLTLKPGDRISAGHLTILYSPEAKNAPAAAPKRVVVFDGEEADGPSTTEVTSLEGALSNQTMVLERGGTKASAPLQALIRAGQELSESQPLEQLVRSILDLAIEAVNAQRGVVMVLENGELVARANKGNGFRISSTVRDRVMKEKCSILVRDAQMDEAFKSQMSIVQQRVRTMMAVPLQTKDRILGLIYLDCPSILREFSKEDLSLLTVMANIAAVRLENARLAEIEQAERIIRRDMAQAAEIQQGILPAAAPEVPGLDLAGFNAPCRTVGGDYYAFHAFPDGRVGLALGDVSGKGMPAALMVMAFDARLRALMEMKPSAAALVSHLNKVTCENCPSNRFITFFFGILDPATGELAFANAGHNPPVLIRASGQAEMLQGGGPVLGILPIAGYAEEHAQMANRDVLVIYSDGVTEANNVAGEEFGEERLIEVLESCRSAPASAIVSAITDALNQFTAGAAQTDDITLVVAKRV
ncbi:MAG: SpoIIE family protein phosphatase [Acidobacteriia bacterium]|nr:SpoIIE family protein phosphatase [Terriglobia bacterium]